MDEAPYTNREIDAMFKAGEVISTDKFSNLERLLFDKELGYLPRIEEKVTYTNGQVRMHNKIFFVLFGVVAGIVISTHPQLMGSISSLLSAL